MNFSHIVAGYDLLYADSSCESGWFYMYVYKHSGLAFIIGKIIIT